MAKKKAANPKEEGPKTLVNRRANFDYELGQRFEAGIALVGSEVKSVWRGRVNMTDAFCQVSTGELWLMNLDIEPYEHSSHFQPERRRDRKLLLHRKEIDLIERRSKEKGLTIIPTRVYFSHGRVKVEVALAKGKREYDRRDQIAKADTRREIERLKSEKF